MLIFADFGQDLQQAIFDAAELLFYPVLIASVVCLFWVLFELGWLFYELYLRFRYRDLEALEIRTLRARQAFADGKPRRAYRYLQENNYSLVVARFLFDLIRNYQTQRLAVKPLKLLQEYEFHTVKRLERTRVLVRIGPMLGLMGTLIPLSPALVALSEGDTTELADNLRIAFSVTVIGLLIGGLAFVVSIVRDRIYSQDISDLEYLLELLEGGPKRLRSGRRKDTEGRWVDELEPSARCGGRRDGRARAGGCDRGGRSDGRGRGAGDGDRWPGGGPRGRRPAGESRSRTGRRVSRLVRGRHDELERRRGPVRLARPRRRRREPRLRPRTANGTRP